MPTPYVWDRITGRNPDLRAADADRERIAERLRTSHAEGRLDLGEFEQRLERCHQAKTIGELDELVRDLPGEPTPETRGALRPSVRGRRPVPAPFILLAVLVVAAAAAGHGFFWLWIPMVFLFWRLSWGRHRRWLAGPRRGPGGWI